MFGGNKSVIRGGYSRVYGRLNGVDLVLVPLLGTGLIQPVQCRQAFSTGACGPDNPTVLNAFRIGTGLSGSNRCRPPVRRSHSQPSPASTMCQQPPAKPWIRIFGLTSLTPSTSRFSVS